MRNRLIRAAAAVLSLVTVGALVAGCDTTSTSSYNAAVGRFNQNLYGASAFLQDPATGAITLRGQYTSLRPKKAYFSVIYANGTCDPAQAFPVGPFTTDKRGNAKANITVPATPGLVLGTQSVSVRRGDDQTDQDRDGLRGPTDVVAVPGNPSIGLVECDVNPLVSNGTFAQIVAQAATQ